MFLLILTTALSFLAAFMPIIIKPVLSLVCIKSKQESALRNEILAIEREVVGVSVMDEFAKYARLKRRMNKLQLDLMYRVNGRLSLSAKLDFIITCIARVLVGLLMLYLIWNYKYTPVIVIPEKWLHPFGTTVRWPTDTVGGISIALWVAVTGTVARMAAASLKSLK